jgi:hypothetical protein
VSRRLKVPGSPTDLLELIVRFACLLVIPFVLKAQLARAQNGIPRFEDYPVTVRFTGTPAAPILVSREQRMFRTRIQNAALKGEGVFKDSDSKFPLTKPGANFAGKYVAVAWGCGSQCVMMAIVDLETGKVYDSPLAEQGTLSSHLDNLSDMEIGYRRDSSLMILRNACRDFKDRRSCGTYYFNWKNNRFGLVKFVYVDALGGR